MLSAEQISQAKIAVVYSNQTPPHHESDDCIRIAYEWLDAQLKIANKCSKRYSLKHLVEKWAGRYISQADVDVAAFLHPDIIGKYPHYNFSAGLMEPNVRRLDGIEEAMTQMNYRKDFSPGLYKYHES